MYIVFALLQYDGGQKPILDKNSTFESVFNLFFGCFLAGSAIYLSNYMTLATGKKQNTCLLVWHIVNVFVMASVYVSIALI